MTEAVAEVETQPIGSVEGRPGVTVVTQENFNAYVDQQLGVKPEPDPEVVAAEELKEIETKQAEVKAAETAPKEGDTDGSKVFFNGRWVPKHDFGYRVH